MLWDHSSLSFVVYEYATETPQERKQTIMTTAFYATQQGISSETVRGDLGEGIVLQVDRLSRVRLPDWFQHGIMLDASSWMDAPWAAML